MNKQQLTHVVLLALILLIIVSACADRFNHSGAEVSVADFGAKGDGIANDHQAFKTAFASGKTIHIPKGTYHIQSGVEVPETCVIVGHDMPIILGGFSINGAKDVRIEGIEFNSWNDNFNYGVRIMSQSVGKLQINNCRFRSKSIVHQDLPEEKTAINISLRNCLFEFYNTGENLAITTVHLHTNAMTVDSCLFDVRGIDGCLKNEFGIDSMHISNNTFSGSMDEEILDFFKFQGDVKFVNNNIQLESGGVIRTKPSPQSEDVEMLRDVEYEISDNTITHSGNTESLIYIAGGFNLEMGTQAISQNLSIRNNVIDVSVSNTPINLRGMTTIEFSENQLTSTGIQGNNIAMYLCGILIFEMSENHINAGRVLGATSATPSGDWYRTVIEGGQWTIEENTIAGYNEDRPVIYIKEQNEISVSVVNNIIDYSNINENAIFELVNGQYNTITVTDNTIFGQGVSTDIGAEAVNWGKGQATIQVVVNNRKVEDN